jgi:hypothetical protein
MVRARLEGLPEIVWVGTSATPVHEVGRGRVPPRLGAGPPRGREAKAGAAGCQDRARTLAGLVMPATALSRTRLGSPPLPPSQAEFAILFSQENALPRQDPEIRKSRLELMPCHVGGSDLRSRSSPQAARPWDRTRPRARNRRLISPPLTAPLRHRPTTVSARPRRMRTTPSLVSRACVRGGPEAPTLLRFPDLDMRGCRRRARRIAES